MARITGFGEGYHTEIPEVRDATIRKEESGSIIDAEELGGMSEETLWKYGYDVGTSGSETEFMSSERMEYRTAERKPEGDRIKNQRAKANALMDTRCLTFLNMLYKKGQLKIDELSEYIDGNDDWIKIGLLMRADYVGSVDSSVQITGEGIYDLEQLYDLKKRSREEESKR